jgi:hypothetical protein
MSSTIRKAKRQRAPMVCMSLTAYGLVAPGLPIPDDRIPRNFALKQQATLNLQEGPSRTGTTLGNMRYETSYLEYYEDLLANEAIWMTFFHHPAHTDHSEHTCGILGTLATIYRRRDSVESLQRCEEVLIMWKKVFDIYKANSDMTIPQQALCRYSRIQHQRGSLQSHVSNPTLQGMCQHLSRSLSIRIQVPCFL